jgi:hypothetical protein
VTYRTLLRLTEAHAAGDLVEIRRELEVDETGCDICGKIMGDRADQNVLLDVQRRTGQARLKLLVCDGCISAMVPHPVRAMLAQFGLEIPAPP